MSIAVESTGLSRLEQDLVKLGRLNRAMAGKGLRELGKTVKAQSEKRFRRTKTKPDGKRWEPWSKDYAKTRGPRHSLLMDKRKLVRLKQAPRSGEVQVGSDKPYAKTHQEGRGKIPARPYLGVNQDDIRELDAKLTAWLRREGFR